MRRALFMALIALGVALTLGWQTLFGETPKEALQAENEARWQQKMDPRHEEFYPGAAVSLAFDAKMDFDTRVVPALDAAFEDASKCNAWEDLVDDLQVCETSGYTCPSRFDGYRKIAVFQLFEEREDEPLNASFLVWACKNGLVHYPPLTQRAQALYDALMRDDPEAQRLQGDDPSHPNTVEAAFSIARACLLGPEKTKAAGERRVADLLRERHLSAIYFGDMIKELTVDWTRTAALAMQGYRHRLSVSCQPNECVDAISRIARANVDPGQLATEAEACLAKTGPIKRLELMSLLNLTDPVSIRDQATEVLIEGLREEASRDGQNTSYSLTRPFGWIAHAGLVVDMDSLRTAAVRLWARGVVRDAIRDMKYTHPTNNLGEARWATPITCRLHDEDTRVRLNIQWSMMLDRLNPYFADKLLVTKDDLMQAVDAAACNLIPGYVRPDGPCRETDLEYCDPFLPDLDCDRDEVLNQSDSCPTFPNVECNDKDADAIEDRCDPCLDDRDNTCPAAEILDDYQSSNDLPSDL